MAKRVIKNRQRVQFQPKEVKRVCLRDQMGLSQWDISNSAANTPQNQGEKELPPPRGGERLSYRWPSGTDSDTGNPSCHQRRKGRGASARPGCKPRGAHLTPASPERPQPADAPVVCKVSTEWQQIHVGRHSAVRPPQTPLRWMVRARGRGLCLAPCRAI